MPPSPTTQIGVREFTEKLNEFHHTTEEVVERVWYLARIVLTSPDFLRMRAWARLF